MKDMTSDLEGKSEVIEKLQSDLKTREVCCEKL
jgi:hypothetical protein